MQQTLVDISKAAPIHIKCILIIIFLFAHVRSLSDFIEWVGGPFEFPCRFTRTQYKAQGRYVVKNALATRIQLYEDDVYVCFPRFKPGIPVTLAKLNSNSSKTLWTPYPDLVSQNEDLHSAVDICVDPFGVLWVLDSGVVDSLENPTRRSLPKVLGFHLETGRKVVSLDVRQLVVPASRLQYLQVDYGTDFRPFVYITDAATRSILVVDVDNDKSYRLVLPKAVSGCRRDVLYAVLLRNRCSGDRLLFTYLSGTHVFAINTDCLRAGVSEGQIHDLGEKDGKIVILGSDGGSAVFYRYEGNGEIYRWDCSSNVTIFTRGDLVYNYPSCYLATEVIPDVMRQRMRVLESNFPDYIEGSIGCGASQRVTSM